MYKEYCNPVRRGFYPDPSVIRVGEDYYMVNSSFQYFPAIPISHSKDLVHWETVGHVIENNDYLDLSETMDSRGIWAPDIFYADGKYCVFATLRYNSQDSTVSPMRCQLFMSADKPEGPYSKPIKIPVDNIDPSFFMDDDGKKYMVIAPGTTLVPLSEDCTAVAGEIKQVWAGTGERCPEGPHIFKKDGYYYAMVAEGGTGYGHGINVARSKSLYGPYENCPYNPVMRQTNPNAPIQRAGHGNLVETQNNQWWCLYLCGRPNEHKYTTIGRETALDPVEWTKDGWFIINSGKGPSLKQSYPSLPEVFYEQPKEFDFRNNTISREFQWVRNPDYSQMDFNNENNSLVMKTAKGELSDLSIKNILLHREQELNYSATLKLDFENASYGEHAGLTCYYSTATYLRFSRTVEGIEVAINRNEGEEQIISIGSIKTGVIYFRVVVEGLTRSLYYSYDGNEFIPVAKIDNCIFLCDEGVPNDPKRHTGTLVGMYTAGKTEESNSFAEFYSLKIVNE